MRPASRTVVLFLVSAVFSAVCVQAAEPAQKPKSGGVWGSIKGVGRAIGAGAVSVAEGAQSAAKSATGAVGSVFKFSPKKTPLEVSVRCEPNPVSVSRTKVLEVRVEVVNKGRKVQVLEFPSTQRADAVVRHANGKIVARVHREEAYEPEPGLLSVNSGERVEFVFRVPCGELTPGAAYTLEGAIVGQNGLAAKVPLKVVR